MFRRILRALGLARRAKLDVGPDTDLAIQARSVTIVGAPRRVVIDEIGKLAQSRDLKRSSPTRVGEKSIT